METQNRVFENVFTIASEKQKLDFVKQNSWGYKAFISLVHRNFRKDKDALDSALTAVLSRKGIVFDAQTRQMEAIAGSLDPATKKLWRELTKKRSTLARLLQKKPDDVFLGTYRQKIEKLNSGIEELESKLASKSALISEELEQRKVTAEMVAGKLPEDSVLAEFVRIQDYDWDKGKWAKTYRYLVFILHPDMSIELLDLGDADRLESRLNLLILAQKTLQTTKSAIKEQIKASEDLYLLLWKSLEGAMDSAGSVIISPDGVLNLISFGALRRPAGKFLAEDTMITYVSSGRDLLRSAKTKPESDLFLAANPDYGIKLYDQEVPETSYRGSIRSADFRMTFGPLPGTAQEAKRIPGLVRSRKNNIVTGVKATESAVLSAKRPKVLHLATHGFFLKNQQSLTENEDLRLSFDDTPKLPEGYENPLVRSGLAFAGANHASKAKTSMDGLLTALEVSGMDLHGTELVTLSACETGVGKVENGEGVYGLRRAFTLSGAENLLMSLWPVSDEITAEQMSTFYRLYGEGKEPIEALQKAQLETITKLRKQHGYAPPSFWAPFILQGRPVQ